MTSYVEENQCSLVELVVGTKNHQLYQKGKESRDEKLNGDELQPKGFHPPRLLPIYVRMSEPRETFEQFKRRVIAKSNPQKDFFNAYIIGDENGVDSPKVSVTYYRI